MKNYRIPKRFYFDHVARGLATGKIIRQTKTHVIIELDAASMLELLDDARFYADASYIVEMMGREYLGLSKSALSTVKVLERQ